MLRRRRQPWLTDRYLEPISTHTATDMPVGWASAPGFGREPAPGTQKELRALIET
jgi:hypothetical protein